jgi:hypothetical protein
MFTAAVGALLLLPMTGFAVLNPLTPHSADPVSSLTAGISALCLNDGVFGLVVNHYLASVFQMIYSLEPAKAQAATRRLYEVSLLIICGHGTGNAVAFCGLYFGHDKKSTDTILIAGLVCTGVFAALLSGTIAYSVSRVRTLQSTIRVNSTAGKALKIMVPLLAGLAGLWGCAVAPVCMLLATVPWLRARAGTIFFVLFVPLWPMLGRLGVYELQQLHKRQAAQKQRQVSRLQKLLSTAIALTRCNY